MFWSKKKPEPIITAPMPITPRTAESLDTLQVLVEQLVQVTNQLHTYVERVQESELHEQGIDPE